MQKPISGAVYRLDFGGGGLVPLEAASLPVGQKLTLKSRWGSEEYIVETAGKANAYGQRVTCLEDGHEQAVTMENGQLSDGWMLGEILSGIDTADACRAARATGADLKRKAEAAAKEKTAARVVEKAKLLAEFPWLERLDGTKRAHSLGSKNLKKELARAFPGIEFTVRSDTFSGGDSIDVGWTLGPKTEDVKRISDKYAEGSFNGMEDIYEASHNQWPELFGGAKYVMEQRSESGPGFESVCLALCALLKVEPPADGKSFWNCRIASERDDRQRDIGNLARNVVFQESYPAGAVLTGADHALPDYHGYGLEGCFRATWTSSEPVKEPEPAAVPTTGGVTVTENKAKGGLEIRFPSKPSAAVLETLKGQGWRWSRFAGCWWHKADYAARALVRDQFGVTVGESRQEQDRFDMQVEDNMAAACGL
jgi:Large polyvalent protein associated domain 29